MELKINEKLEKINARQHIDILENNMSVLHMDFVKNYDAFMEYLDDKENFDQDLANKMDQELCDMLDQLHDLEKTKDKGEAEKNKT